MYAYRLTRTQLIPRPIEETFAFFADAANLEAITPEWLHFQILTSDRIKIHAGACIEYRLRWRFFPFSWLTEIRTWEPPFRFVDVQKRGPYKLWEHEHTFDAVSGGTLVCDAVRYALPFGVWGRMAHFCFVSRDLDSIFDYRARRVAALLTIKLGRA
jgi:ligand-binding SRPBCC domain-containing protein